MKFDKNQQKRVIDSIFMAAGENRYKAIGNTIYKVVDNVFVHCDFLVVNSKILVYRIYIKKYVYDDIFWKILQMPSNSKKGDSLRAKGAFKAPSILLTKGEIELTDKYEEQAKYLVGLVEEYSFSFMIQYDIDKYILDYEGGMDKEVLKCLAYIHMNNIEEAKKIARISIGNGNRGNFENEGKEFFEWVLDVY